MASIFKMAANEFFLKIIIDTIKMRVFYPTGVREGIYCDLLAITTLNLVIISPNTKVRGYIVFAEFLIIIIIIIKSPEHEGSGTILFLHEFLIISPNTKVRGYIVFAAFLIIIILLLLLLLLNSDLSAPLLEKPFEITEIDQVRKIDHHERKCNRV